LVWDKFVRSESPRASSSEAEDVDEDTNASEGAEEILLKGLSMAIMTRGY